MRECVCKRECVREWVGESRCVCVRESVYVRECVLLNIMVTLSNFIKRKTNSE